MTAQGENIHDLVEFMRQVSDEMSSEYGRIRRRSSEDPGTAGDQGEENWASLLRDWLPPTYEVVTKGRIIGADGTTSPQVDLIVLKDVYPRKLLDKKLYLADGVAAAFECKTTLRAEHIGQAVATSVKIKQLYPTRGGTPYQELHAPIIYGLLAHSHEWKSPNSRPRDNVTSQLAVSDHSYVTHPRESLDVVCVADLGTWTLIRLALVGSNAAGMLRESDQRVPDGPQYEMGVSMTAYAGHTVEDDSQKATFTPIGSLIASLTRKLAQDNPSLRGLAGYYPSAGISGDGIGLSRFWAPCEVYSDEVHARLLSPPSGGEWSEWENVYL